MKFTKGYFVGNDVVIELSKQENLELRRALNECKKDDKAKIQLNVGSYFSPRVVNEEVK